MTYIIYTLEQGGDFKLVSLNTDEETKKLFDETIKSGILRLRQGDAFTKVRPAYICLAGELDNYDFVLKRKR